MFYTYYLPTIRSVLENEELETSVLEPETLEHNGFDYEEFELSDWLDDEEVQNVFEEEALIHNKKRIVFLF